MYPFKIIGKQYVTWGIEKNIILHAIPDYHTILEKEGVKAWKGN